jgi:hypothetical protein
MELALYLRAALSTNKNTIFIVVREATLVPSERHSLWGNDADQDLLDG